MYFTYHLSVELSSHIKEYVNNYIIDNTKKLFGSNKRKERDVFEFWRGSDGKSALSNYSLNDSKNVMKFANKNNAFIMMFKSQYYQRSKKLITPTTLRKSFVTYLKRIGDDKLLDEAAASMLHSKRIQDKYYSKLTATEKARNISNFMRENSIKLRSSIV